MARAHDEFLEEVLAGPGFRNHHTQLDWIIYLPRLMLSGPLQPEPLPIVHPMLYDIHGSPLTTTRLLKNVNLGL